MAFQKFNLIPELLKAIEEKGYENPTPIQAQAIPLILAGYDLLAGSQTGTGKTAGFTLPMLQNLMKRGHKGVRALVLAPTRELVLQVEENVRELAKHLPLKSAAIFGGVNIKGQVKVLNQGVNIIIATPGRLLDLVNQKIINLAHVEILVLDEADRMLDMGFIHDIRRILKFLPAKRQNLLFSATFSEEIKRLASGILHAPKMIEATKPNSTVSLINQVMHPVDSKRKAELLSMLIKTNNWQQVLVFMRTKHSANKLVGKLEGVGIKAAAIHGNKSQSARVKALDDFKKGIVSVLVATDIAARGIDIDQLPHVVNFDLPNVPEDYVHRIGRTGRAGNSGEAVSLVSIDEHEYLRDIERLLKHEIPKIVIPNFQPDPSIKAQPISHGRQMAPKRQKRGK
ncbi:MAG TPA: DEAD/DEAH box helicase [Rhabdochlamydiaceae bacterium]|jgi:ATP-dependent RNA helicase RhlE